MASQLYNQLNQKMTEQMVNNMIRNNPQAMQIINEMKQSGQTPKDFFFKKASEMGVNSQDILNELASFK